MRGPYRTNARPPDEPKGPSARQVFDWLRFHLLPPLFTRCPYCHTRHCVHANLTSYYALTAMVAAAVMLLRLLFS